MASYADIPAHSITINHLTYDVANRLQKSITSKDNNITYPIIQFGENINAGELIAIIDNKAYKASNTSYDYHCQGVAIINGTSNYSFYYAVNGTFAIWDNLTPNKPVFLGINGLITQTPNFTANTIFQEIGTAISETIIKIDIKTPKINID